LLSIIIYSSKPGRLGLRDFEAVEVIGAGCALTPSFRGSGMNAMNH